MAATRDRAWRIWISESARDAMCVAASKAHPYETGGVLAGVIAAGRPWITHVKTVSPRRGRPSFYTLPEGKREQAIRSLRRLDPRIGYLGDWHSHPVDVGPSCTDCESIRSISLAGDLARPVLVVVRWNEDFHTLDARQWTGRRLRSLRVVAAGDLPPSAPRRRSLRLMELRQSGGSFAR